MAKPEGKENAVWVGVKEFYAVPFRVFRFFMHHFIRNRNRLKVFMSDGRVSSIFAGIIVITAAIWIVVAMNADETDRNRLTDAVEGFWSDTQALNEEKKRLNAIKNAEPAQ